MVAVVLQGVGEYTAGKHNEPRELKPHQQQEHKGKAAIDGVVIGHINLARDKEPLHQVEHRARDQARGEGTLERHLGVGDEFECHNKGYPLKHNGCEVEQPVHKGRDERRRTQGIVQRRGKHNLNASRTHERDWNDDEKGRVVDHLAGQSPVARHAPYAVEGTFHVAHERDERPQHEHDAYAHKEALRGMQEVAVDKL